MHLIHEYGLVAVAAIIGLECLGLPVAELETARKVGKCQIKR
jgi:hypothetical protein